MGQDIDFEAYEDFWKDAEINSVTQTRLQELRETEGYKTLITEAIPYIIQKRLKELYLANEGEQSQRVRGRIDMLRELKNHIITVSEMNIENDSLDG